MAGKTNRPKDTRKRWHIDLAPVLDRALVRWAEQEGRTPTDMLRTIAETGIKQAIANGEIRRELDTYRNVAHFVMAHWDLLAGKTRISIERLTELRDGELPTENEILWMAYAFNTSVEEIESLLPTRGGKLNGTLCS